MSDKDNLRSQRQYVDRFYPLGEEPDPILPEDAPVLPSRLMHEVLQGHLKHADDLARGRAGNAAKND
jgi:hypothetical protein